MKWSSVFVCLLPHRGRLITGWRRGSVGRTLRPCCRRRGRLRPNCCGPTSQTNCSWPRRRSLRYNTGQNQHGENNSDEADAWKFWSLMWSFQEWGQCLSNERATSEGFHCSCNHCYLSETSETNRVNKKSINIHTQ